MLTAILEISGDPEELRVLVAGRAEVQVRLVHAVAGPVVVFCPPLLIEALAPAASMDPAVDGAGALVRVYVKPDEDRPA